MSWSLEGLNVSAVYLDQFPISGTVALSRVQYGGQVCHTIILDTPLVVYGSLRDRVIIDHSQVNRVRDNNSVNQALQQLAEDISISRLYLGLHYESDAEFGKYCADVVLNHPDFKRKYKL